MNGMVRRNYEFVQVDVLYVPGGASGVAATA